MRSIPMLQDGYMADDFYDPELPVTEYVWLMEAGETCALAARSRIDSSGTSWIWPSIKAAICPFVESDLLLTISDRNIIGSLL